MDHVTAMTPDQKKAELARRQVAHDARLAQAKRETKSRLETARKMSAARSKPGCATLPCLFVSRRPPSKKDPAAVAAAGQGGGTDKKDPPEVMDVIPFVRGLAAHKAPGLEYEVVSPTSIKIPARDGDALKAARDLIKKEDNKVNQDKLKAAQAIVGWFTIEENKAVAIKTFDRQAAKDLIPLSSVQLVGVEAVYRSFVDKKTKEPVERIELMCGMPVVMESQFSTKVMLSETVDLHQLPVQLPDANEAYPGIMVVYFKDYTRSLEDEDEGRGCVVSKMLANVCPRE